MRWGIVLTYDSSARTNQCFDRTVQSYGQSGEETGLRMQLMGVGGRLRLQPVDFRVHLLDLFLQIIDIDAALMLHRLERQQSAVSEERPLPRIGRRRRLAPAVESQATAAGARLLRLRSLGTRCNRDPAFAGACAPGCDRLARRSPCGQQSPGHDDRERDGAVERLFHPCPYGGGPQHH